MYSVNQWRIWETKINNSDVEISMYSLMKSDEMPPDVTKWNQSKCDKWWSRNKHQYPRIERFLINHKRVTTILHFVPNETSKLMRWLAKHQTGGWLVKCDYTTKNPTVIGQWHHPMNINWTISNDYDNSSVQFDNLLWDYSYEKW